MIFLGIGIIAVIITFVLTGRGSNPFSIGEGVGGALLAMLIWFCIFGGVRAGMSAANEHDEFRDIPIVSLQNKTAVELSGSFILGCGSISGGEREYYVTYGKFPKGLKQVELQANRMYINETDSQTPKIIAYEVRTIHEEYKSIWFFNRPQREGAWAVNPDADILIVPENTIYKEFSIK